MPLTPVVVMREEFEAIREMFAAKAVTSNDRVTLVDFWARCIQKIAQFREAKRSFEQERRFIGSSHPLLEDGKMKTVTQFNQELDALQEKANPGCLRTYVSAMDLIEEFQAYVLCIEVMLGESKPDHRDRIESMRPDALKAVLDPKDEAKKEDAPEPPRKRVRKEPVPEPEPESVPTETPAAESESAEEGAPAEEEAPKQESSFQKIMKKKV